MKIITTKGLKNHLEKRVFVMDSKADFYGLLEDNSQIIPAKLGILRCLNSEFYLQLCKKKNGVWGEINKTYTVRSGDIIGVKTEPRDLDFYKVNLLKKLK